MIKLCAFADEIDKSLQKQIIVLVKNGISLLELRSIDGVNVKDFTDKNIKEYSSMLTDNGISVWSIGSPLGKVDISIDFSEYESTIKRVCEIANGFNAKKIRVFSFFNAFNQSEKVFERLNRMVEIGRSFGVEMCHENEKDVYGDNLDRVKKIISNVKGLKHVYDPANFAQVGEDAHVTLTELFDNIDYFHIKDVIKSTDQLVPAGYGDGKIDKLIQMINSDRVLTLEPHLALFEGYSEIDKTQMKNKFKFENNEQSFNFAVKSLKELLINASYKQINNDFVKE